MTKTALFAGARLVGVVAATSLLATAALAFPPAPPAPPAPAAPPAPPAPGIHFGWNLHGEIPSSLDWRIEPVDRDSDAPAGAVEFELGYSSFMNSSWYGRAVQPTELAGLSPAQLSGPGAQVSFVLRRDAGEFRCHGATAEGKGVGTCSYVANGGFAAAMAKRGVTGGMSTYAQFEFAISDVGFNYLDELRRGGYATPNADLLVRAVEHGVSLRQLTAVNATGYRFGDVETLIRLRDHGVSARYLGELHGYGYARLSADDLVRLRDHGVSSAYLKGLSDAGFTGLSTDQVTKMRDHGVSASFVAEVRTAGFRMSPDDLERMRDHGVSAGFLTELHAMGYDRLTADDIIKLRDRGISAGFIRTSNQGGQRLSPDDLIRLRDTGGARR